MAGKPLVDLEMETLPLATCSSMICWAVICPADLSTNLLLFLLPPMTGNGTTFFLSNLLVIVVTFPSPSGAASALGPPRPPRAAAAFNSEGLRLEPGEDDMIIIAVVGGSLLENDGRYLNQCTCVSLSLSSEWCITFYSPCDHW